MLHSVSISMFEAGLPPLSVPKVRPNWKVAIVRSSWHRECTEALFSDALDTLLKAGLKRKNILDVQTPGSFEIPLLCQRMIQRKRVNGVIALGIVLEGETHHARMIATESARSLMDIQLKTNTPIAFEILYVRNMDQARARSIGRDAKGRLAALTILNSLARIAEMR